jgi:hypothetical protein
MARDYAGIEVFCSQTVSVVSTAPPILECPSDQTVAHSAAWDFGVPTARDATATPGVAYDNLQSELLGALDSQGAEIGNEIVLDENGGFPTRFELCAGSECEWRILHGTRQCA